MQLLRGGEVRRNFEVCMCGGILKLNQNGEQTFVVCCFLHCLYGEKALSLGNFAALANTGPLRIFLCHSGCHFPFGGNTWYFQSDQLGRMLQVCLG